MCVRGVFVPVKLRMVAGVSGAPVGTWRLETLPKHISTA